MPYETYTTTRSTTFTVTHAQYVAIKVGTDLKRMQRFYGEPRDDRIADYEKEFVALLKGSYLDNIEYGFVANSAEWRVALRYAARYGGVVIADDDPGKVRPGVNIVGCLFHSFLVTTFAWHMLPEDEKERVYSDAEVSFRRTEGNEPSGNWLSDKTYSAGGRGVQRSSLYVR